MADDGKPLDLYETDFVAWTQVQAAALRAQKGSSIDWARVAEEIEDMGKSETNAAYSLLARIVEHLHKLRSSARTEPKAGWRHEIRDWRRQLARRLTPTIRNRLTADLEAVHSEGLGRAEVAFAYDEPEHDPLDADLRWTLPQLLGEADDPLTG
jgi:ribosomal protein L29